MSKTSLFLVFVMCTALCYMGAVRAYQFYERKKAEQLERDLNDGNPFTFQNIPIARPSPLPEAVPLPVAYTPPAKDIFLEDMPLSEQQENEQAQQTITSIIDDFREEESLRAFNEQLNAVSQGQMKNLDDLSTKDLKSLIQSNPEIAAVVSTHMKNPDFARLINEIFSNPQFQQSVAQLQGQQAPKAAYAQNQ